MEGIRVGYLDETTPIALNLALPDGAICDIIQANIMPDVIHAGQRFTEDELDAIRYVTDELDYIHRIGKYPQNDQISRIKIATVRKMINQ